MPESRFYEEKEAEEILRLAVSDSVTTGAMTRERLVATAAELGISEDAITRAEQHLASQRQEQERLKSEAEELAAYKAYRRGKVFSSLGGWISTSIMLVGIDLLTSHSITWSVWPVGIWGLAELGQVFQALMTPTTRGERFERWRRRQQRRSAG